MDENSVLPVRGFRSCLAFAGIDRNDESNGFENCNPRAYLKLNFPDGEKLEHWSYIQVKQSGDEAKDTRYAERDLRMLASLTGGEFLPISTLSSDWQPSLSDNLPTIRTTKKLNEYWLLFVGLFLLLGLEWLIRRKEGLK